MRRLLFAVVLLLGGTLSCFAQTQVLPTFRNPTGSGTTEVSAANPLPVSASVSASISGFHQESVLTPLSVTVSNTTSGAFTAAKTIIVANAGTTNTAYCALGNTATTSGQPVPPLSWVAFTSTVETTVSCITASSTTTVNVSVGTGLPTGAGGGGGSGSAITNYALENGGNLASILTAVQQSIVAGSALIGGTTEYLGTTATVNNPCATATKQTALINIVTAVSTKLIAGTSAKKTYVCSMFMQAWGAQNVRMVEGTKSSTECDTGQTAVYGGTTAGQGLTFTQAGAGIALGNGSSPVLLAIATNADDVCLITSAAQQLSGIITYVQQ